MSGELAELEAALAQIEFPEGFLEDYDQLECLAHGHGTETFLVRKKGTAQRYIAKCYDLGAYGAVRESEILRALSRDGLPAFAGEYRNGDFVCVVREYMEGTPLNRYMAARALPASRAVALCARLCDLLTYLHTRNPSVIHRDIKPQNVIVRPDGDAALIDFDIARAFEPDESEDTLFAGTRVYAPPEQYGFAQTDCRADIYSLGVLLCYMLTGRTDVKYAPIRNKRLAAVVRRCTAFAPERRFQTAAEVKRALLRAEGGWRGKTARACAACVALLALLCAGFALGRHTELFSPAASGVVFSQPIMERAARAWLGKGENEPLTREELLEVRELYVFGTEVSASRDAFVNGLRGWTLPRGSVTSLRDVELMPNLETLYVNYQPLSDVSPVSYLKNLRYLDLRHTYAEDISPLAGLPALENVVLFDTNVKDVSPLADCPRLDAAELGRTLIDRVEDIPAMKRLKRLSLKGLRLESLNGIGRFAGIEWLCLCETGVEDLSPALELPRLREIVIDESMREAARKLGARGFEVLCE